MKDEKLTFSGGRRELCFRVTKGDSISDPEAGRVARQELGTKSGLHSIVEA